MSWCGVLGVLMDISRAVDDFVSSGILLFHHLQAEGQSLSPLELHTLAAQLQVPQSETTRLRDHQSRSLRAPALAPILRMFDHHSMDLYWDSPTSWFWIVGVFRFLRLWDLDQLVDDDI